MNVALVGAGRWGRRLLPELTSRFAVSLCCTTGGADGVSWLSREHPDVRHTAAVDDALSDGLVDAVVIATPSESHAELAQRALRSGKHVFVEKPLATSYRDAKELETLARQTGLVLFVGHVYLYHPVLAELLALTRDDPVSHLRGTWSKFGTFDSDLFWNLASHDVSLALALLGAQPTAVELLAAEGFVTDCDFAVGRLHFEGGGEAVLTVDRAAPERRKTVSIVTRGRRRLIWQGDSLYELEGEELVARETPSARALARELDAFHSAVERGASFPSDGAHGTAVVKAISELRERAEGRR